MLRPLKNGPNRCQKNLGQKEKASHSVWANQSVVVEL
jgi:hypothetical protein